MDTHGERRVAVIIEDDADIRHLLETVLSQAGFEVVATGNGLDGVQAVRAYDPMVTTLDVSMPGIDGFEAAKRIRAFSNTYLVMLTARDEEIDTLQGLEAGADDYLTKPFRPRELRARVEAMMRRPRQVNAVDGSGPVAPIAAPAAAPAPVPVAQAPAAQYAPQAPAAAPAAAYAAAAPAPDAAAGSAAPLAPAAAAPEPAAPKSYSREDGWLEHNSLFVNSEMRLAEKDGKAIDLTRSEFDLLNALMESQRRVRSKADLALLLRGESYVTAHFVSEADKRAIEVHMANLRRKLADSITTPRWIETVRGVGYRLAASEDD
ncbi:response regulator transcription factor [Herbiconiux sp. KACC 21604]|uniref:response regulator transcription factor n=1 Tax=unclassified Herbiconiux TaxID=2618217 RepID=UPI001C11AB87|nr:response regulator transcription factor [Herbiconiux sp. SALV-R1]WPO85703.1 response regulator transcription factor [Herbiconiux sp. KACC 21604]